MSEKRFDTLSERLLQKTLPNGLRISFIPKDDFSKTFAMLATDFGSVDKSFTLDGQRIDTPVGVAHFLEHKMFEEEDGNALQKFAVTGASPNAFTSQTMTAYHFSCTSGFEKNLEILLKFVFTPYFTDENVEKEKGIIGQEIGMMDDTPTWQAYMGLFQGIYHEHPVREDIAGSVESISGITPELLYQCHRAFYSPANMTLVVCGKADFDTICRMAEEISPKESARIAARHYGTRGETVLRAETERSMQVSIPYTLLGLRDMPLQEGESKLRRTLLGELACRLLMGETAPLYAALYEERLINASFESEYSIFPEGAVLLCGGESRDPHAMRDRVLAEMERLAKEGVSETAFRRARHAVYGMYVRTLDEPGSVCRLQAEACFGNEDFLDFPFLLQSITAADVVALYDRLGREGRASLSVIWPKDAG